MNRKMKRKRSGTSRNFSIDKAEAGDAKQSVMPTATKQTRIGVRKTIAYGFAPTRQRTSRLKNSRNPERPETTAVMIMAATNGPNGFGPLVRPRNNAMIHGYQDATKVCRLKKLSCHRILKRVRQLNQDPTPLTWIITISARQCDLSEQID
jgi:hypothetical protein